MRIAPLIRESFLRPRLKQAGALVVYDPEQRYREVCVQLAEDDLLIVDAATNSIDSRLQVSGWLIHLE